MTDEPQYLAPDFTPAEENRDENGVRVFDKVELYSISLVDDPPHPSWRILRVNGESTDAGAS